MKDIVSEMLRHDALNDHAIRTKDVYDHFCGCYRIEIKAMLADMETYIADRVEDRVKDLPASRWNFDMAAAPRDGTRIFGYFPRGKIRTVIAWRENVYEAKGDPNWTTDDGESANLTYDPPTAWQALPPAPGETV